MSTPSIREPAWGQFVFVDKTLIPGAPRAVGSALYAAGFHNVRLVLQQWNPNILPSAVRFDGQPPEVLLVSAMQIHSAGLPADPRRLAIGR